MNIEHGGIRAAEKSGDTERSKMLQIKYGAKTDQL